MFMYILFKYHIINNNNYKLGDIKKLSLDWKEIRPTVMFGVPRIYNKTYDKVVLI